MRVIRTEVTASAGIRVSCLFQGESMGGMAAVASFLDHVAAFTESSSNFLRNTKVLSLDTHAIKADGMSALTELLQLSFMTLPTFFRENHGLLLRGSLMVDVAGHTMDIILCMLRFHP